ncbi:Serine/threonine-protein kinase ppk34 [Smittium culicis]|uniref:Serine/threonine-protein kinase ppk34 n=1 Tax=Smittium culicis TaxID=133412 RepID=A0A1R1X9Q8_9FUNG|nr:Serine/threonine-protein kinase ppk34 [Smittium culicis]
MSEINIDLDKISFNSHITLITTGLGNLYSRLQNFEASSKDQKLYSKKAQKASLPSAFKKFNSDLSSNNCRRGQGAFSPIYTDLLILNHSNIAPNKVPKTFKSSRNLVNEYSSSDAESEACEESPPFVQTPIFLPKFTSKKCNVLDHSYISDIPDSNEQPLIEMNNRYKVLSHLGSGEFSDVFLAYDSYINLNFTKKGFSSNRIVSLKLMKDNENDIGLAEYSSLHFIQKKKSLDLKKYVVSMYDIFKIPTSQNISQLNCSWKVVLVMEPLFGGVLNQSLAIKLDKIKSTTSDPNVFILNKLVLIKDVTSQILAAINALHKIHIIHADLKPANIMFVSNGINFFRINLSSLK